MRSWGALGVALHTSLLALLAHGIHKPSDGVYTRPPHRFALTERGAGYHLPSYMMQLYRNFKSNFSGLSDTAEQDATKQADTVKSMMAKSKRWLFAFKMLCLSYMCRELLVL